jgi:hypothetical protein
MGLIGRQPLDLEGVLWQSSDRVVEALVGGNVGGIVGLWSPMMPILSWLSWTNQANILSTPIQSLRELMLLNIKEKTDEPEYEGQQTIKPSAERSDRGSSNSCLSMTLVSAMNRGE